MRRFVEVERSSLPGLNLVRRSLMYDGAMLFKALKVSIATVVGLEANVAHITLASYDHVLNTAILCGQQSSAHAEVWKSGNQADRREDCYNCQVLMTQMHG